MYVLFEICFFCKKRVKRGVGLSVENELWSDCRLSMCRVYVCAFDQLMANSYGIGEESVVHVLKDGEIGTKYRTHGFCSMCFLLLA